MKTRLLLSLVLAFFAAPALADGVCYGTLDGTCHAPDVRVASSADITLPGDLYADTVDTPVTLTIALRPGATFAAAPTIVGSAAALVSSPSTFVASGAGPFALTGLRVQGTFSAGDAIVADVRLVNPNMSKVIFDAPITLARVRGVTDLDILTINPGGNPNQQTFLRLVNAESLPAVVVLNPTDDSGQAGGQVTITIAPGAAIQVNSDDLEQGNPAAGVVGSFGHGTGKWRAHLSSDQLVHVQALVRNRLDGTLTNLSGVVQ